MRAVDLIRKKRDGGVLDRDEIGFLIAGLASGTVPDYQAAALLMAIVLRGMTSAEAAWLTEAMVASGERMDLSGLPGPTADKHSTGGVGDKTSLIVAPLVAACGVRVPMMSGRGLGHTGGTLDKLEAIPGFRTALSIAEFRSIVERVGCVIAGQSEALVPADRTLYALRDVTATVESIPLISASIMSKKIAEGVEALVLDVKCGRGSFMRTESDAVRLAESLVAIGNGNGVRTEALVTAMDAPLGRAVGNALEVVEAIDTLAGRGPDDVRELSVALASRMIVLAGAAPDLPRAEARATGALASGAALEKLREMIAAQGGEPRVVDDPGRLPAAPHRARLPAPHDGVVRELDAGAIGHAAVLLGAGRSRMDEAVDPAVGLVILRAAGERVKAGEAVLELHFRHHESLAAAMTVAAGAIAVAETPAAPSRLVLCEVR